MRFGVGFKVLVWVRVSAIMVRGVDGFQLGLFHNLCTPNDSDARKCAPFPCTLSLANPHMKMALPRMLDVGTVAYSKVICFNCIPSFGFSLILTFLSGIKQYSSR